MAKNRIHNEIDTLETSVSGQSSAISTLQSQAQAAAAHAESTDNPHSVTPAQIGAATTQYVDNAVAAVVADLDWKEMVATFEDLETTYPNAVEGWTASVAADNLIYRYDGENWVVISGGNVPLATENNNGLMSSGDFSKLAAIEPGATADQSAAEVDYDNQESTLLATNVKGAIDELDLKKLDATALSASLAIFPTITPSDIVTSAPQAVVGVTSITDPRYPDATNISTGAITGTEASPQIVGRIYSDPGIIVGSPGVITISTLGNIRKTSGGVFDRARFFFRVFRYDGVAEQLIPEHIAESDLTPAITSTVYEEFFAFALLNNGIFAPQDRLVIQFYAIVDGGSGAVYEFEFGGETPVRTLLPVPVSVIPAPDASMVITDTENFDGLLSGSEDTVQAALDVLDDHNHNGEYFTKEQLRPVTGDPQVDDFNTAATLDGRYPTFPELEDNYANLEVTDEIIGDVSALDGRVTTLEQSGGGGGLTLLNLTATIPDTNWSQTPQSNFTNTINVGGVPVTAEVTSEVNFTDNRPTQNDFTNLPPQTMTFSSNATSGPVTLTKNGGGVFDAKFVGTNLIVDDPVEGNLFYVITEIVDTNTLTVYYQPGPNQGRTLSQLTFDHNQGSFAMRFLFVFENGTGPDPEDPKVAQIGAFEEQTNQVYSVPDVLKGATLDRVIEVPENMISITNLSEIPSGIYDGVGFYAVVIDNEFSYVANGQGIRKIAKIENGNTFINVSPNFLEEQWSQAGGDLRFITPYAITQGPDFVNAMTLDDWAEANFFGQSVPLDGAQEVSISFALTVEQPGESARTQGVVIEFSGLADTPFTTQDTLFLDLDITPQNINDIELIETAWSSVKATLQPSDGQITFIATEQPQVDIPIKVGVFK